MSKNREKTFKIIEKSQKCFKPEKEREKYGKRSQKLKKVVKIQLKITKR